MTRGDIVTVALQGDQGKPRPALVIRSDFFTELPAVTILPITSTLVSAPGLRIDVPANAATGLVRPSQIMVDKPQTPSVGKVGAVIGRLDGAMMVSVNRALTVYLGLA